jgi:hypothetical protein
VKYPDVRGELQAAAGRYSIQAQSADIALSLNTEPDTITDIDVNALVSGNYVGFYEKSANSFEFHADLIALKNGIVTGSGNEDNRQFTLFGMFDEAQNRFFFVRIKGNDVTYYTGDTQLQTEIFFQGKWNVGRAGGGSGGSGGFALIKCMP